MAEYSPDFDSVDETFDFDCCPSMNLFGAQEDRKEAPELEFEEQTSDSDLVTHSPE